MDASAWHLETNAIANLMAYDQHVVLALEFHDDRFKAYNNVSV